MAHKKIDIIDSNKAFAAVGLITAAVLMIPLIGMQLSSEVEWGLADFMIIGILLFGMGSLFVIAARHIRTNRFWLLLGIIFLTVYLWAELAVGIFTRLGS